ncbi:MAG: GNAT family N-acetyltransferase [Actinomycetota bacterium]
MLIRDATPDDLPFLERMWHTAAFWQPEVFVMSVDDARQIPEIARYIDGWGRPGDVGLIAEEDELPLGAAWYRTFSADDPGYGFVDDDTPELAIAVDAEARRRGVATSLLDALITRARDEGKPALSLSVNTDNPSRQIYERCGFVDVRSDDGSFVMVRDLRAPI